jgi:hypothetical protein
VRRGDSPNGGSFFLRELLVGGPLLSLPSNTVRERVEAAGFAWSTVRRAKNQLGILAVRESEGGGGAGRWLWSLPKGQAALAQTMQAAQAVQMKLQAAQAAPAAPTQVTQPPAAQPPSHPRTITVKRPGIAPVGPDEISHELWQSLGCSVERLKKYLHQRSTEIANV